MGIGFVLAIYGLAALLGSLVGGAVLSTLTLVVLRGSAERKRLAKRAALFPAKCAAWAAFVFVFQAFVNVTLLHRDAGLGDGFDIPLPDHYAISYIDVTDYGLVYNPRTQLDTLSPQEQADAVSDVRLLQTSGRFLAGASDTHLSEHFSQPAAPVDHYFVIDTQTNKRTDFATEEQLRQWTAAHNFQLKLEPISDFYQRYRWTWFDGVALLLLLLPPAVGIYLLVREVLKSRRFSHVVLASAAPL